MRSVVSPAMPPQHAKLARGTYVFFDQIVPSRPPSRIRYKVKSVVPKVWKRVSTETRRSSIDFLGRFLGVELGEFRPSDPFRCAESAGIVDYPGL